jgi:hydrogenase maturation protease
MNRILAVGIGSLIMTDDGIGPRVAGAIRSRLQDHEIAVLIGETDVQYCLDMIRPDDFLVIIDSTTQGREPGSIVIEALRDTAKSRGKPQSQHDFSLLDAVSLVYPDVQGCLIGIEAAEIVFGPELSKALEDKFDMICDAVLGAIAECCTTMTAGTYIG